MEHADRHQATDSHDEFSSDDSNSDVEGKYSGLSYFSTQIMLSPCESKVSIKPLSSTSNI